MILLVNKPTGPTSHDMVNRARTLFGERRIGHAGTLDPFAHGLLILLIGRESTKRQQEFLTLDKTYEMTARLGATSSTDDCTGVMTLAACSAPTIEMIRSALCTFTGSITQRPPQYSAKKVKGVRAYTLARKGRDVQLAPKQVTITLLELLSYSFPFLTLRATVSSGTYMRALARDLGERLGSGGFAQELVRTSIGPYHLSDAREL